MEKFLVYEATVKDGGGFDVRFRMEGFTMPEAITLLVMKQADLLDQLRKSVKIVSRDGSFYDTESKGQNPADGQPC